MKTNFFLCTVYDRLWSVAELQRLLNNAHLDNYIESYRVFSHGVTFVVVFKTVEKVTAQQASVAVKLREICCGCDGVVEVGRLSEFNLPVSALGVV
jgi:hypothetical protein